MNEPSTTAASHAARPRENPFRSECVDRLKMRLPAQHTWETLLARLESMKWCGAIVGPHGSGKTTLIEQLAPHLEARGFRPHVIRFNAETKNADKEALLAEVRTHRAPDILLLDGAEQLTTRQWLPLRIAADALAGFVITVHRSSRLTTLIETETTPELLNELVWELSGGSLSAGEAAAMHARYRGNLRECFRELYDRWM